MNDLEKLKDFLGNEVAYSKQGMFVSQIKYVLGLLKETGSLGVKRQVSLLTRIIRGGRKKGELTNGGKKDLWERCLPIPYKIE